MRNQSLQLAQPLTNHGNSNNQGPVTSAIETSNQSQQLRQLVTNHKTVSGTLTAAVFIQSYKQPVTNHKTVSGTLTADVFIQS